MRDITEDNNRAEQTHVDYYLTLSGYNSLLRTHLWNLVLHDKYTAGEWSQNTWPDNPRQLSLHWRHMLIISINSVKKLLNISRFREYRSMMDDIIFVTASLGSEIYEIFFTLVTTSMSIIRHGSRTASHRGRVFLGAKRASAKQT